MHMRQYFESAAKAMQFAPTPIQQQILNDEARFITWLSGARSGKSILAGFIIAATCLLPNKAIWIVGPTYDLAKKEFTYALSFLSNFKMNEDESVLDWASECSTPCEGMCRLAFSWGSYIETRSTDNPRSLLGVELDLLVLAEAACVPRSAYDRYLRARIGSRVGKQLAFSTGAGDTGLFSDFVQKGRDKIEGWSTYETNTLANPYFNVAEYELAKKQLDKKSFEEQFEGKLVSPRGKVFNLDDFTETPIIDVDERTLEKIKAFPVFVSIKYFSNNVSPLSIVAFDSVSKTYYVIYDTCTSSLLPSEIVQYVTDKLRGFNLVAFLVDAWDLDTYDRLSSLSVPVAKIDCEKPLGKSKAVITRARNLIYMLKLGKLKIARQCENTLAEFDKCKWPDPKKESSDQLEGEIPLPKFFQLLYLAAGVYSYLEG